MNDNDFWANIFRYPKFFISSLIGLVLIILAPFKNFLKLKKFQFIFPFLFFLAVTILSNILKKMTGT